MGDNNYTSKIATKIPRYGNWGGPEHDGFKRLPNGKIERDPKGQPIIDPNKMPIDALDWCFFYHDLAYAKEDASPWEIMQADAKLIQDMQKLDIYEIGPEAARYRAAAISAFIGKLIAYDVIAMVTNESTIWWKTRSLFDSSATASPLSRRDPLALDLDGDGLETLAPDAHFDHDGDGFAERTGWVSSDDGILVRDVNGDGRITSGRELFGDQTLLVNGNKATNGFEALAELDRNFDGRIDSDDDGWNQLQIWRDFNGDGYSTPDELFSLGNLQIAALGTISEKINLSDSHGNVQTHQGAFTRSDGTSGLVGNIAFQRDPAHAIANEWLAVPEQIDELPDLQGYGNVYDLHQAMVRDGGEALIDLIEQFKSETDVNLRDTLMNEILWVWTGNENVASTSRGPNVDARELAVLEKFLDQPFHGAAGPNPSAEAAVSLKEAYRGVKERYYAQLMVQTHLKSICEKIIYSWDEGAQIVRADLTDVISHIQSEISVSPVAGEIVLGEFARSLRGLQMPGTFDYLSFRETFINLDPSLDWVIDSGGLAVYEHVGQGMNPNSPHIIGTDGADAVKGSLTEGDGYLNGFYGNDVIYGKARDETLINEDGNAVLVGGQGDDRLWAGAGDDILDGGQGADLLVGEAGNDTYLFRRGAGRDTIIDSDPTPDNSDTLWLGSLAPQDVTLDRVGNHLVLAIKGTTDQLTVTDFFKLDSPLNRIERIVFADGTVWHDSDILENVYLPSDADDILYGGSGNDTLNGLGGNDRLYGLAGNDTLIGDVGSDGLYGGSGDDTLAGGAGNDTLDGGAGSDTYLLARGGGHDIVVETDTNPNDLDIIVPADDVAPSDTQVTRSGNDVTLTIAGSADGITIRNFCDDNGICRRIEGVRFAEGTVWGLADIAAKSYYATEEDDVLNGFATADQMDGAAGNDRLFGAGGDDVLAGGAGNDLLYGEKGDDRLCGNEGDDQLYGGIGDDVLDGGPGNDVLRGGGQAEYGDADIGNDTYLFSRGSGRDTVVDKDYAPSNRDVLRLADDIQPSDVTVKRYGDDLVLALSGQSDSLTIANWFRDEAGTWQIETIRFGDGTLWDPTEVNQRVLEATDGDDVLTGYAGNEFIQGLAGNDSLLGRGGEDRLSGGAGDDRLSGEAGDDWLDGGQGRDDLRGGGGDDILDGGADNDDLYGGTGAWGKNGWVEYGGNGDDTYLFGRGSGQDRIVDCDATAGNRDTIVIGSNVTPDDIRFGYLKDQSGEHLVIGIDQTPDCLRIHNWFAGDCGLWRVERIEFNDGTVWEMADINARLLQGTPGDDVLIGDSSQNHLQGLAGNDSLSGRGGDDILDGASGNDVLNGEAGSDTLLGGEGTDTLVGGDGGDVLDGGPGDDVLMGQIGDDRYLWGRGAGRDTIIDKDLLPGNTDAVIVAGEVSPAEVVVRRNGDDLVVGMTGTTDGLTIKDWFKNPDGSNRVEEIRFADGTAWDATVIKERVLHGTPGDDVLIGYDGPDVLDGKAGNDTLIGGTGDDTYVFGRGAGQDTVIDTDHGSGNVDTIELAPGVLGADVTLARAADDLFLVISGSSDGLRVSQWFADAANRVEAIVFADGTVWDGAAIEAALGTGPADTDDLVTGSPGVDVIDTGGGNDAVIGMEGNDTLHGGPGDDYLEGGLGDDQLFGAQGQDAIVCGSGKDVVNGGPGNDLIYGLGGENTYVVEKGGGVDRIVVDLIAPAAPASTVIFGEGIGIENLSVQVLDQIEAPLPSPPFSPFTGPGLPGPGIPLPPLPPLPPVPDGGGTTYSTQAQLAIGIGNGEGLLIQGTLPATGAADIADLAVKSFVFADGTTLTLDQMLALADAGVIGMQSGTSGDEVLLGSVAEDTINGGAGNDWIDARDGDDRINGYDGNDTISGGRGDDEILDGLGQDVIAGGKGDDWISGWGDGQNVYAFNRGDGNDTLDCPGYADYGYGIDAISFGPSIRPEDVTAYADLNDMNSLVIRFADNAEQIKIYSFIDYGNCGTALDVQAIGLVQFLSHDGQARVFDLKAIYNSMSGQILGADADAPVPLLSPQTMGFELPVASPYGGEHAMAYALTGDLFSIATVFEGNDGEDTVTTGMAGDTINAGNGDNIINAGDGDNSVRAGAGNDRITSGSGNDMIDAGDGDNWIVAGDGDDVVTTGAGNDVIDAGGGDDTLAGGGGSDAVAGGPGNDTYHFNLGNGILMIDDLADASGGNQIVFGENITASDLRLRPGSLVIEVGSNADAIYLSNFDPADASGARAVQTFAFFDGQTLSYDELVQMQGFTIDGTQADDLLLGTSGNDRIAGFGGQDRIAAGPGNDILDGGSGNDTYLFNRGDGQDRIRDATEAGAGNTVQFGAGITLSDLSLFYRQNLLTINVADGFDALHLEGFDPNLAQDGHAVAHYCFDDGSTVTHAQLLELGIAVDGTSEDDVLGGTAVSDTFRGRQGDDWLKGGAGVDAYLFGRGDGADTIEDSCLPGEPNTLVFGSGIAPSDLSLRHDVAAGLLIIGIGNTGDAVRLAGFNPADPYGEHAVAHFQFDGGQILTYDQLIETGFDLEGTTGDDTLTGTGAADRIVGHDGADNLYGAAGNDDLHGGAGNDTYWFNLGDGKDVIDDLATAAEDNTLVFGEGITLEGLNRRIGFAANTLIIRPGDQGDEVRLTGFDPAAADTGPRAVQTFKFADGTLVSYEQLVANTFVVQGDGGDDSLAGTNMTDRLYGYEGFDRLEGGAGDDTLTGGTGNDDLIGGAGSDTYVFNAGDGIDTIDDLATAAEGNLIVFGEGIGRDDLSISRSGNGLTLQIGTAGDAIRLVNFDPSEVAGSLVVRALEFADGTRVPMTDLLGTAGDDVIITGTGDDVISGRGGSDTIVTGEGWDTISGGPGNDTLQGGAHNDTYVFNLGDGLDTIIDTVAAGQGNRIVFGPGITPRDIGLSQRPEGLRINVGGAGDGLLLAGVDPDDPLGTGVVETLVFANDTEVALMALLVPAVENYSLDLSEDGQVAGAVVVQNAGFGASFAVSQDCSHGTFTLDADGAWTYAPEPNFNGTDQVVVALTNPWGRSAFSTLDFAIEPVNDAPVAPSAQHAELFGVPGLQGQIGARDVDGDTLAYSLSRAPAHGTLAIDPQGCWTYTPQPGYCGEDAAQVAIDDGHGGAACTDLSFTVNVYQGGDRVINGHTQAIALPGVSKDDLTLARSGDDLAIAIANRGSLTLSGYFAAAANGVDRLETLEGPLYLGKDFIREVGADAWSRWLPRYAEGQTGVRNLIYGTEGIDIVQGQGLADVIFGAGGLDVLNGKAGNDTLIGGSGTDALCGKDGHDTLYGEAAADILLGGKGDDALLGGLGDDGLDGEQGDDWLFGDEGRDVLDGGAGNDRLVGGPGEDALKGGEGSDTYCFNPGDGCDQLRDKDGGNDTVRFGQGITVRDVALFAKGNTVYVQYGQSDRLELSHQHKDREKVERLELADGHYLTDADVNRVIQQICAFAADEGIHLKSVEDVRRNEELMTLVAGSWQAAG